jgi:hypothetical protein
MCAGPDCTASRCIHCFDVVTGLALYQNCGGLCPPISLRMLPSIPIEPSHTTTMVISNDIPLVANHATGSQPLVAESTLTITEPESLLGLKGPIETTVQPLFEENLSAMLHGELF